MSEPLYCISFAQICDWLSRGAYNGITIKKLGPGQGYSVALLAGDKVLVSSLSESLNEGIAGCYDGANEVLNEMEARMYGTDVEEDAEAGPQRHNS
jgi:hypothetical protein